jgi:L-rhamnose mutarotase
MQTFAQAIDLVDDAALIDEYVRAHRAVWPEVEAGLRAIGIRSMRIWRLGPRLFMVCEAYDGFDPARDYQRYADDPRTRAWDELMRRFQRPAPGARPGEWWAAMERVYELRPE